jgi:filamentous hemagglutinin family protein
MSATPKMHVERVGTPAVQLGVLLLCAVSVAGSPAAAVDLPAACAAGLCGAAGPSALVTSGAASLVFGPKSATITQTTPNVVLNWSSFNVSADGAVTFVQPSSSAIALNRIFQQDASKIFGTLKSNGTIYLLNQNGFLFGQSAVVNVGGLLATSLNISPDALQLGIGNASSVQTAAFQPYTDSLGRPLVSGDITVQHGATIDSAGGQVLLFAPNVENAGRISTPDGQTIIGAGKRVFLAVSSDPNVRGLLVEVGDGGTATNDGPTGVAGGIGEIIANRGNVTIAGLAVNQSGRVSATTTTRVNGSVILQARSTSLSQLSTPGRLQYDRTGALAFGAGSETMVQLEGSSTDTAVDVTTQPKSTIDASGNSITIGERASLVATSGNVVLVASTGTAIPTPVPDAARIYVAPSAVIDVSGASVTRSVEENSLQVQLRGSELADNPAQRDGPLRGQSVWVDVRKHGVDANGNVWVGTPLADLTGDVSTIRRDVFERNLAGGTITMTSTGSVLVSAGSKLDISGGAINWQSGYVKSTVLLGANGVAYDIGSADPNRAYVGTLDSISLSDPHWGTSVAAASFGRDPRGTYTSGYVEGKDAGTLMITAPGVVLDGTVAGHAVDGPLQRLQPTALAGGQLYRWSDQAPLGGALVLGNLRAFTDPTEGEVLGNLTFAEESVLPTLRNGAGGAFDPTIDTLPASFVSVLRPSLIGADGVSRVSVGAEGTILLPAGVSLQPGAGGSIVLGAGRVVVDGLIATPGGAVSLLSLPTSVFNGDRGLPLPGLWLGSGAAIAVGGEWINESPVVGGGTEPMFISGGSVSLTSTNGSLAALAGSAIDVSGGARESATGAITAGRGGSITVTDRPGAYFGAPGSETVFASSLTGYALANGGTATLKLPALCLSGASCADPQAIAIRPSFLTDNGFGSISLGSTLNGFEVTTDVNLTLSQMNWSLSPVATQVGFANSLFRLAHPTLLPVYVRQPMSLSLSSTTSGAFDRPFANLVIDNGASLTTDPTGSISLQSDTRIFDDGRLTAQGGRITLDLVPVSSPLGLQADQAIWLGASAAIDVSGTTIYTPSAQGLKIGHVLAGGSISLLAESGYLVALSGATLDASGTAALVDVRNSSSSAAYTRYDVATAGGAITLFGAEGIQFDAGLRAAGGMGATATGARAPGGLLAVSVNGDLGSGSLRSTVTFPSTPRVLTITAAETPFAIVEGASIPLSLNGQGRIAAPVINAGGFDQIQLLAGDLLATDGSTPLTVAVGSVAFESGVALLPGISLIVNGPDIHGIGAGTVRLSAPYVALGSSDTQTQLIASHPPSGSATLDVAAQTLDLVGAFTLSGFTTEHLGSAGDIRAVGVQLGGTTAYTGQLVSAGALDLLAQQIYPASLTSYTISLPATSALGTLTLEAAPGQASLAMTANGSLTLQATRIDDAGVVRAPFGTVNINAPTVNLLSGSVVSVSGAGLDVLYGQTQGGLDWTYPLNGAITQVYGVGAGRVVPPQKQVNISGANIDVAQGATIDVSGGGDYTAYEFTAGVGGTHDVLSNTRYPNVYAVLPGTQLAAAPLDPLAAQGSSLAVGSSVYLAGGAGLAAGVYTLLPARYALLPGAYIVKPVAGYTDLAPTTPLAQFDGSVIVGGYRVYGGTPFGDTRSSGFDIAPGTYAYKQASYTLTSANQFFAAQAQGAGVAAPRLPQDAGALAINATQSATLAGSVDGAHVGSGTRGAAVDLSSANIYVGASAASAPAGYLVLDPTQLDALGAESLLLGGTRAATANGTALTVGAGSVVVADGAVLSGQEIVLAARSSVQISSGATVDAQGAVVPLEGTMTIPSGTAIVRTSTGGQQDFAITGTGGAGSVTIASGATLAGHGSIAFNSGGTLDFKGSLDASGASVRLGSTLIGVGDIPIGFTGFALTPTLVAGLGSANLELSSPNSVQFFGTSSLSLDRLALLAPGLTASTPGASLTVGAVNIVLGGPGSTPGGVSSGTGSLTLNAATVTLSGGAFAVSGVASTAINSSALVVAQGDGTLATSGDLQMRTPLLITGSGVNYGIAASGAINVQRGTNSTATTLQAAAGGRYQFDAASIVLDSAIVLPAGQILATASVGDVVVGADANLNVSGFTRVFDGQPVNANGGQVTVEARQGSVSLVSGARVDVSAGTGGGGGGGGSLSLLAPGGAVSVAGTVLGTGATGAVGASLSIDATSFSMSELLGLNGTPGFDGAWHVRLRGAGDLAIAAGQTLRTGDAVLAADRGGISVAGTLDASGPAGHTVTLSASGDVRVDGSVRADATGSATRGGTINLQSESGGVYLDRGATLAVGGVANVAGAAQVTDTGSVWIRMPQSSVQSVLDPSLAPQLVLAGSVKGAAHITVEGVQSYSIGSTISADDVNPDFSNPIFADAAAFAANATAIATALGRGTDPAFQVVPGVELRSTGNVHVSAPWDLSAWRFGDAGTIPGILTVRAAGNLYVDNSISDGFFGLDASDGYTLFPGFGPSWSYRLVAGADLTASQPLAVVNPARLAANSGDLVLAAGTPASTSGATATPLVVRTGTGFIDVAAARDLRLLSQASVIYTAGTPSDRGLPLRDFDSGWKGYSYPTGGGDVSVAVGRDVVGALNNQLYSNWLWRAGTSAASTTGYAPAAWLVAYGDFEQGIGAFGGGDVSVVAGRNILDLSANVTTTGVPIGNGKPAGTVTEQWGSGLLTVTAGNDIRGGKFLAMADGGTITAGGAIGIGGSSARIQALYPILAIGNSALALTARRSATIETIINPTLLPRSTFQPVRGRLNPEFYSTYGDRSLVSLASVGGDVTIAARTDGVGPVAASLVGLSFTGFFSGYQTALQAFAPSLTAASLSGNVVLQSNLDLWPSARGTLNLLANGSVDFLSANGRGGIVITQSDVDPSTIGTVANPGNVLGQLQLLDTATYYGTLGHAPSPMHGGAYSADGLADPVPNRIVALQGDIAMQPGDIGARSVLLSAKPIDVSAGRDIVDLGLSVQNLSADSVDAIVAGRDVIYTAGRSPSGSLLQNSRSVDISGPGEVLVQAGRDVNLLTSSGFATSGNLGNAALPASGANLSVIAGVGPNVDYAAFIDKYLGGASDYDKQLIAFVTLMTGTAPSGKPAAITALKALLPEQQAQLVEQVFIAEIRTGGRAAAAAGAGHGDFSRAFAALQTLFPGSNPDLSKGEMNPYHGDILLYFSRLYTLSGGNIDLYAPGGQINVGLAAAPTSFGISKSPSQLGIVAQAAGSVSAVAYSDVQVNQSRIFAANGGSILIWSTEGNIDAGRGSKTAISAPPPVIQIDSSGQVTSTFPAALTGSGIQTLATSVGTSPGDVDLFAPRGVVNANDAGIVAGNLTIAATAVLGANNISFSGTAVGVPVQSTGLGASLASAASSGTAASGLNGGSVENGDKASNKAPLAESALNWLEVFVVGLGDDVCRPDDIECLRRQRHN